MNGKVLVSGATGLVGTHVMLELLGRGYAVCALYRSTSNTENVRRVFRFYGKENLFAQIEWREGDVCDRDSIREALKDIDTVYHTAAMVSFASDEHDTMWHVNVDGTSNMVEESLRSGVSRFCHVSSIGAIGHTPDGTPIDELTPYQPDADRTVYSQSKFRQEMEVWRGIEGGLKAVIVNPGVVIGPGDISRSTGTIAKLMRKGTRYYTGGATGYVDARDVARAMVDLTEGEHFGERYILVGQNSTAHELQNMFADAFGVARPTRKAARWMMTLAAVALKMASVVTGRKPSLTMESVRSANGSRTYDASKVQRDINISFRPLEDSVQNMASFYRIEA